MAAINLGASSWQFDGWRGVFYPDGLAKQEQLAYYARHFNSVESNTSFYGLPRPATLIHWVESVPSGFTFCLKFPRAISHDKRLVDCQEETLAFFEVIRSLGEAAAPCFLQLPPDFTRQRFGRSLALYLDWLATHMQGLRIGVEARALDLMTPAFARFVAERGICWVVVEREGTPDMFPVWDELVHTKVAPSFVLVRWIGDDKNGPQGDAQLVAPRNAALALWAQRLVTWLHAGLEVFGYMHNPYEGHSPASLRRLQAQLTSLIPLPAWPPSGNPGQQAQLSLF
jgi:uncharacterized protein YecE (DUF72 family)